MLGEWGQWSLHGFLNVAFAYGVIKKQHFQSTLLEVRLQERVLFTVLIKMLTILTELRVWLAGTCNGPLTSIGLSIGSGNLTDAENAMVTLPGTLIGSGATLSVFICNASVLLPHIFHEKASVLGSIVFP